MVEISFERRMHLVSEVLTCGQVAGKKEPLLHYIIPDVSLTVRMITRQASCPSVVQQFNGK